MSEVRVDAASQIARGLHWEGVNLAIDEALAAVTGRSGDDALWIKASAPFDQFVETDEAGLIVVLSDGVRLKIAITELGG